VACLRQTIDPAHLNIVEQELPPMRHRTAALGLGILGLLATPALADAETVVRQGADRCAVLQALGGSCSAASTLGTFGGANAGQGMGLVIEPTPAPAPAAQAAPAPVRPQPVVQQPAPVRRPAPQLQVAAPRYDGAGYGQPVAAAFPSIEFELNSATLTFGARQMLDTIASALRDPQMQGRVFIVEGHTDASGDAGYNQRLSEQRARSVVHYLESLGIGPGQLQWTGRGETAPSNLYDPYAAENRRVVFLGVGA
jgi:outer membrane protein OmpA-like peptidoglycan-associated protein